MTVTFDALIETSVPRQRAAPNHCSGGRRLQADMIHASRADALAAAIATSGMS